MNDKLGVYAHDRGYAGRKHSGSVLALSPGLPAEIHACARRRFGSWTACRILAPITFVILTCVAGCSTSREQVNQSMDMVFHPFHPRHGTISANDLKPDYKPQPVEFAKTADLAKLARPSEVETRINAGDLLEVSCSDLVEESKRETFQARVADDGTISLPLISERLPVESLTSGEAEQVIRTAYVGSRLILHPQVMLRTVEYKKHTIYVIGAVKKPGVYELQPDECDPLRAIVAAEGVTEDATTIVEVRRAAKRPLPKQGAAGAATQGSTHNSRMDQQGEIQLVSAAQANQVGQGDDIIRFDLKDKAIAPTPDQLKLQNGDIVSVEPKKIRPIYVSGSVNKPGEFPMPVDREMRVLEAVGLAGGVLTVSEPTSALVIRRPEKKEAVVIHVDLANAAKHPEANFTLMEGDVISVVEDGGSRMRRAVRTFINLGISFPVRFPF